MAKPPNTIGISYLNKIKYESIQGWPYVGLSSLPMLPTKRNLTHNPIHPTVSYKIFTQITNPATQIWYQMKSSESILFICVNFGDKCIIKHMSIKNKYTYF